MKFLLCLLRKLCKNGPLLYATGKKFNFKDKAKSKRKLSKSAKCVCQWQAVKHTEDKIPVQSTSVCPPLF